MDADEMVLLLESEGYFFQQLTFNELVRCAYAEGYTLNKRTNCFEPSQDVKQLEVDGK